MCHLKSQRSRAIRYHIQVPPLGTIFTSEVQTFKRKAFMFIRLQGPAADSQSGSNAVAQTGRPKGKQQKPLLIRTKRAAGAGAAARSQGAGDSHRPPQTLIRARRGQHVTKPWPRQRNLQGSPTEIRSVPRATQAGLLAEGITSPAVTFIRPQAAAITDTKATNPEE